MTSASVAEFPQVLVGTSFRLSRPSPPHPADSPAGMVKHMLVVVLAADIIQKLEYDDYKFAVCDDGVSVVLPTASGRWAAVCSIPCSSPTNDELESTIAAWNKLSQDERHALFLKHWPVEATVAVVSACGQIRCMTNTPTHVN